MEEEKRVSSEAHEEPATEGAEAESAAADGSAAVEQDAEIRAAETAALRTQNDDLNDRNLRLVAEMENLRRRTERDKSEFAKYAISEFARDVLSVGDNIRRGIEAVPKEAVLSHPALASLIEGIEVTERELLKVLERYQVKRFDPLGEPFNPNFHEAMTKVDVPNVPAETVIQVIHAGYMIGERVLRPAAVIVAKGGGAGEQPPWTGDGEETIPPGTMRVPNDAVSSASPQQAEPAHPDFRARVGGLSSGDARRSARGEERADETISAMRRARQGAGAAPFNGPRQQNGAAPQNKSSTLHKPVIGSKQEW